jgi:DNA-binding NarL/FixJ family response regulator
MTVRVVLADDSLIIRAGLCRLLEADGCHVVAEVDDAEALRRVVALESPDAAIVDIRMPPTHTDEGIRAATAIRREHPETSVLVLSQYVEAQYALELLAGAGTHVGYLLKERVLDRAALMAAVWRVCAGEVVVDHDVVASLLEAPRAPAALAILSARQHEVLALMAEGLTDHGIAQRLVISPKTVATHVQHIFLRLGLPDTTVDNKRVRAVLAYLRAAWVLAPARWTALLRLRRPAAIGVTTVMTVVAATAQAFFTDRPISQRQASQHTAAYRDAIRMLLQFASSRAAKPVSKLDFADLNATTVAAFLDHLERERANSIRSRNTRLAAIHSLFAFAALRHPEHNDDIARVLAIPSKRTDHTIVEFLTDDEVDELLNRPDRGTRTSRRDHTMLQLAVQTGLRASELTRAALPGHPRRHRAPRQLPG